MPVWTSEIALPCASVRGTKGFCVPKSQLGSATV